MLNSLLLPRTIVDSERTRFTEQLKGTSETTAARRAGLERKMPKYLIKEQQNAAIALRSLLSKDERVVPVKSVRDVDPVLHIELGDTAEPVVVQVRTSPGALTIDVKLFDGTASEIAEKYANETLTEEAFVSVTTGLMHVPAGEVVTESYLQLGQRIEGIEILEGLAQHFTPPTSPDAALGSIALQ